VAEDPHMSLVGPTCQLDSFPFFPRATADQTPPMDGDDDVGHLTATPAHQR
jgi:hypothetical protein